VIGQLQFSLNISKVSRFLEKLHDEPTLDYKTQLTPHSFGKHGFDTLVKEKNHFKDYY